MSELDERQSTVLLENDRILVTEERVPVGGSVEVHTHTEPFLLVGLSGDRGQVFDADGNLVFDIDYKSFCPGFMGYIGPDQLPNTHSLRNIGNELIVVLQIDLLGTG
jgi:hypothetical protein